MPVISYREALRAAMREELKRDEKVVLMGEEVAQFNGAYKVTEGLLKEFGPKRVVDTPISEAGFIGLGIGASMLGIRPVMELTEKHWDWTLDTNARALLLLSQRAAPISDFALLRKCGTSKASSFWNPSRFCKTGVRSLSKPLSRRHWR